MIQKIWEPNILYHYFDRDSATANIVHQIRQGMTNSSKRKFDQSLIERARREAEIKMQAIDASTYPFAVDFHHFTCEVLDLPREGKDGRPVLVSIVSGSFVGRGEREEEAVVAFDWGTNPHLLFSKPKPFATIDDKVAFDAVMGNVKSKMFRDMKKQGYTHFAVDKSGFFYIDQEKYAQFGSLEELSTYLLPIKTQINGKEVVLPSKDKYVEMSPDFSSFRLKRTLGGKIMSKSRKPEGYIFTAYTDNGKIAEEQGVVSDVGAHRRKTRTKQEVYDLLTALSDSQTIGKNGRTDIEVIYFDDRYKKIENLPNSDKDESVNKYGDVKIVVRAKTRGYEPVVREIQLVDNGQFWDNEYRAGRNDHSQQKKKQNHIPRPLRSLDTYYSNIVSGVFLQKAEAGIYDGKGRILIRL